MTNRQRTELSRQELIARWLFESYSGYVADENRRYEEISARTRQDWLSDAADLEEYLRAYTPRDKGSQ
jgi:hypothetical protein